MKLKQKISLLTISLVSIISIALILLHTKTMQTTLQHELIDRGVTFAKILSKALVNDVINNQPLKANQILTDLVNSNHDIEYIYITDFNGQLFTHTFGGQFPKALLDIKQHITENHDGYQIFHYQFKNEKYTLISTPLIDETDASIHVGLNHKFATQQINATQQQSLLILLVMLAIAIMLSIYFSDLTTKPLVMLTDRIRQYGQTGQTGQNSTDNYEIKLTDPDIKALADTFNNMVEERQVFNHQLENSIDELQNKNQELEGFTYTVSHDLKSPLLTITGFLGAILTDLEKDRYDRIKGDIKRIQITANKMYELINELLELSRIGKNSYKPEDASMHLAALESREYLRAEISERKAQIDIEEDLPATWGEPTRLTQVFQNLISNAVHYMGDQPNPQVIIGSKKMNGRVVYFVKDNGIGIEKKDQDRIFDLFSRIHSDKKGTGVGLAIVKKIIDHHHGRIWVESDGKDQGSTFFFILNTHLD